LCLTHYNHMKKHGEVREIRPYRPGRRERKARLSGLRLAPEVAGTVRLVAGSRGVSSHHQLVDILEQWAQRKNRRSGVAKRKSRTRKRK
jgi:hypothetical protein